MENIKIRKMKENDIDFVLKANIEVHESSRQENEILNFKKRIYKDILNENPKAFIIIVEKENIPIGMALFSTVYFADEGEILWLSNLYVERVHRNKGVGKQIIDYLKDVCIKKGYYPICGSVDKDNKKPIGLFDSIDSKWINNFNIVVVK